MKRSSSIAALDDTIDVKLRNDMPSYEDSVLVTSMMLVTIAEENRQASRMLRKQHGSLGSMSTAVTTSCSSLSRCSSGGSLRGWGSTASRKSYKVDLCSLADGIISGDDDSIDHHHHHHHHSSKDQIKLCPTQLTLQHQKCGASGTAAASHALDSWGFFL